MIAVRRCQMCGNPFDAVVGIDDSLVCPDCEGVADFIKDFQVDKKREPIANDEISEADIAVEISEADWLVIESIPVDSFGEDKPKLHEVKTKRRK